MCLAYDARPSTKDVDAVFFPSNAIREAAKIVAKKFDLPHDWLNDGVNGFLVEHPKKVFLNYSNLAILISEPEYLLAMKALASRVDGTDKQDIAFLIRNMKLTSASEVFRIVETYYPKRMIKPATQFFLEELFDELDDVE